ncbi:MAG: DinB family protein [Bacteroidota bacterium]
MNTFFKSFSEILLRDLDKLQKEIEQYPDEASVWVIKAGIKNSAGTLVLHLCGNLQHYIGVGLGKSDYKRDRDKEFSARNVSREDLVKEIAKTKDAVKTTFEKVSPDILETEYPYPVFEYAMTVQHFMIHLAAHFGYHLGQVNYHRRLTAN